MPTNSHKTFWLLTLVLIWTIQLLALPAFSLTIMDNDEGSLSIIEGMIAGKPEKIATNNNGANVAESTQPVVPATFSQPGLSVPVPGALMPQPAPAAAVPPLTRTVTNAPDDREKLMVTHMNGDVRFKHLQGPRLDPERALLIETGQGTSWCECKMQDCTSRVSAESQVSIFPDTGILCLEKGALVVKACRGTEGKYTVIAGNLLCRVQSTTLRVLRNAQVVSFQVLDGTVTVYNRQTGEIFRSSRVTQPVHQEHNSK